MFYCINQPCPHLFLLGWLKLIVRSVKTGLGRWTLVVTVIGVDAYPCLVFSDLTQWIMAILSKACKLDNFESYNSLKLSFTNIWGLHSNFVDCESFLELSSPDIPALCETNLDDSIDSSNFSEGYLPLIQKDSTTHVRSTTHMHGPAVYVKDGLPFARDLSLENCVFDLCFRLALLQCLPSFPLSITFFIFMHSFWFYFI